jgi:hypothetical protein
LHLHFSPPVALLAVQNQWRHFEQALMRRTNLGGLFQKIKSLLNKSKIQLTNPPKGEHQLQIEHSEEHNWEQIEGKQAEPIH